MLMSYTSPGSILVVVSAYQMQVILVDRFGLIKVTVFLMTNI